MRWHSRIAVAAAVVLLAVQAAVAGIISGEITAISKDGGSVTVETSKGPKKFKISENLPITVDDKKAPRAKLTVGMKVSVFTDSSDQPSKLIARTESKTAKSPARTEEPAESTPSETEKPAAAKPTADSRTGEGGDWPQYLGPDRNNISKEKGLLRKWPASGPKMAWKEPARGLGSGYSSVSVADGMIYTMGNRGNSQSLLAMDFESGEGKWEIAVGPAFREGNGDGPRSTPTVVGEFVYAMGAAGELLCAEAKTGTQVWTKNILNEFGGNRLGWGICESVLVDGDRLICTPGGRDATMAALDPKSGQTLWKCKVPEGDAPGYASAIKISVGGVEQYVQFTQKGTIGVRAEDGKFLWREDSAANGTANCSSPQFFNDMVFSASGYGHGGAMVRLMSSNGETQARLGYHTKNMKSHHGGFVIVDGYVYGSNEDVFMCLDLKTGQTKWQSRNPGKGSLTCADGMLFLRSENGPVTLAQAVPTGYRELGRFEQPNRSDNSAWAYPVVSHGRLFLRDMDLLLCYDVKGK